MSRVPEVLDAPTADLVLSRFWYGRFMTTKDMENSVGSYVAVGEILQCLSRLLTSNSRRIPMQEHDYLCYLFGKTKIDFTRRAHGLRKSKKPPTTLPALRDIDCDMNVVSESLDFLLSTPSSTSAEQAGPGCSDLTTPASPGCDTVDLSAVATLTEFLDSQKPKAKPSTPSGPGGTDGTHVRKVPPSTTSPALLSGSLNLGAISGLATSTSCSGSASSGGAIPLNIKPRCSPPLVPPPVRLLKRPPPGPPPPHLLAAAGDLGQYTDDKSESKFTSRTLPRVSKTHPELQGFESRPAKRAAREVQWDMVDIVADPKDLENVGHRRGELHLDFSEQAWNETRGLIWHFVPELGRQVETAMQAFYDKQVETNVCVNRLNEKKRKLRKKIAKLRELGKADDISSDSSSCSPIVATGYW